MEADDRAGEWFRGAGFGMFVHWDHASQNGVEISWPLVGRSTVPGDDEIVDDVTVAQYQSTAATFDPQAWDARSLARLAKRAGASYVVFTARHHAGYSMFFSEHTDFGIQRSRYGRDLTREFVDAVREEGLKVGIYYSLPDWNHPDYPAFQMTDRPYAREHWPEAGLPQNDGLPIAVERHRRSTPEAWERYQAYLRGQLTELLLDYGPIDILWFDGDWERSAAEWDSAGLRQLIRSLQPGTIVNDRLPGQGDYFTPEQGFPLSAPDGPWELCMTIGRTWAWRGEDRKRKSTRSILSTLAEVTSRGGNLLLNVGPRGDGSLDTRDRAIFEEIASWMEAHRDSVIGVEPSPGIDFYGPVTERPGRIYLHLVMLPIERITVRGIPISRVRGVRLLATGASLSYETNVELHELSEQDVVFGELLIEAPRPSGGPLDVVVIELAD